MKQRLYKDKAWLLEKHYTNNISICKIARMCRCNYSTIIRWMKKYNIKPIRHYPTKGKKYEDIYGKYKSKKIKDKMARNRKKIKPYTYKIPPSLVRNDNNQKLCKKCKKWKSEGRFRHSSGHKDGLDCYCKRCKRSIVRERYSNSTNKDQARGLYKTNINVRYCTLKAKAKNKNQKFLISFVNFKILIKKHCYYCNKEPNPFNGIDRIDSSKGYEIDNCVACCAVCNFAKHKLTQKEFAEHIILLQNWAKMFLEKDSF